MNEEIEKLHCRILEYQHEVEHLKSMLNEARTVFVVLDSETGKIISVERNLEVAIKMVHGKDLYLKSCEVN